MTISYKKCSACGEIKSIDNYTPHKGYVDNYKKQCKQCDSFRWSIRLKQHRKEALESIGDLKCQSCNIDDYRVLVIDHLYGGGNVERKALNSVVKFYKLVKEQPERYQILCHNCNYLKRIDNNEHGNIKYLKVSNG